jgi:DNA-binding CsgD family transcriptional regulator
MNPDRSLDPLVDKLYNAAEDPAAWTLFLSALCAATDTENAALVIHDLRTAETALMWCHFDPVEVERYRETYAALNPWIPPPGHERPVGVVVRSEARMAVSTLRQTRFYREWGLKNNVVHSIAMNLGIQDDRFTYLALSNGEKHGPISDHAEKLFTGLTSHLARAIRFQSRLGHALTLTEALDRTAGEVFFTGVDGRLIEATPKGRLLLEQNDILRLDQGTLQAVTPSAQGPLERALRSMDERMAIVDLGRGIRAVVTPVQKQASANLSRQSQRMLAVLHPDTTTRSMSALAAIFSLTPAETRLTAAVLETGRLTKAAAQLAISPNTAKTQIAAIFEKTGTNSQGELIRLFSSLGVIARLSSGASA